MTDGPTIDGRSREELLADLRRRADNYTDEWDPHTEDAGTTLLALFARFGTDVLTRLNDVPHKHRVAFLNALDFDRRPPQAARVPLTFTTTADIEENVVVGGGTQVTAETDDGASVIFEIPADDGFEATAAALQSVYSVEPATDSIYDHGDLAPEADNARLFSGTDRQAHEWYLGHEDLLNLERDATVSLSIRTPDRETLAEEVTWEYYGEDEHGEVGWHLLPRERPDVLKGALEEEVSLEEKMERVSERIRLLGEEREETDEDLLEPTFRFPGPTEATAVDGVESRWIRATVPGDDPAAFAVDVEAARLDIEGGTAEDDRRRPAMTFSNDVPLSVADGDFRPFGRLPTPPTTLYLASEEALTKRGGEVELRFAPSEENANGRDSNGADEADAGGGGDERRRVTAGGGGPLSGPPEISWEYWNGNGWTPLGLTADGTDAFQSSGSVRFTVPDDLAATSVSGHDNHWIRARLVSGNYGQPEYELTEEGARGRLVNEPEPPVFGDLTISYGQQGAAFEHVRTSNNVAYQTALDPDGETVQGADGEPLTPFVGLPDDEQTLYLGFDARLQEGPINLHLPMTDKAYPRGFDPGIRWEYCENPTSASWKKLDVYDGTEGLTERGIVSVNFPEPTEAFELFGERRHWVRARVTRDSFVTGSTGATEPDADAESGGRTEPTAAPEAGVAGREGSDVDLARPPTLVAITPNTQWAYNERTVEETLGGSDGSPDQTFDCDHVPITEAEVWVNEAGALSGAERREFAAERLDDTREEDGEFWVRWQEADDFLESGGSSRHYRLDRTSGRITFGDGQRGAIPPSGEHNVEAVYQTGGGSEGNVDAGAVTDLRSSISRIDAVTNRRPADGGTDVESLDGAVERAPRGIKNRGRAVSAEDFEQIAMEASRQLATVRCEPEMDEAGDRTPGWVTLLIIPRERRDRPTPSLELRERVSQAVGERAPATLVGRDVKRIVVRGPDYAEASVETTVDTRGVESITNLKTTIEETLEGFFHPLTGGRDGEGWAFSRAPTLSQLATLVAETEGVDRVREIAMTIETASEEKIVRDPEKTPWLARDEMISSGTHEVNVIMRGQR